MIAVQVFINRNQTFWKPYKIALFIVYVISVTAFVIVVFISLVKTMESLGIGTQLWGLTIGVN